MVLDNPKFQNAKHIHFMGIKGVGVAATAIIAKDLGIEVSGSDVADSFVTDETLLNRQIVPSIGFDIENIPTTTDLVVYTGAHQGINNPQVIEANNRGIRTISQAEAVGELMANKIGISVCGVGGKTSTSAMLATALTHIGDNPSYLVGVGNIPALHTPAKYTSSEYFIAEADEYVVSPGVNPTPRFMFQTPKIIICTQILHDHPDQYKSIEDTQKAFAEFFHKLPSDGILVYNSDSLPLKNIVDTQNFKCKTIPYNTSDLEKHSFLKELAVPGEYNQLNALAAYLTLVEAMHFNPDQVIAGLKKFMGTKRRFEKIGEKNNILFYVDYAHHPSEIAAVIKAAKEFFTPKRLVVVFQPHTYSRTKVLLEEFSHAFNMADEVIVTDIYASKRETIDPTINSSILTDKIKLHNPHAVYIPFKNLPDYLNNFLISDDIVLTLGAGDIYTIHKSLV